ncbi:something about silencing protein 10-like [Diadema antillarum]|uniref:something about silencing protein 10-like n=1 Tax=Diadema antillarum TaxID=105358 RepID=UPI003A845969
MNMGKRRKGGHQKKAEDYEYDSDDPRAYENEKVPDPTSREYFYDDVDEFHANKDKINLETGGAFEPADSSENEEEILGWDDEDDDEEDAILKKRLEEFRRQEKLEEIASDLEEDQEDGEEEEEGVSLSSWGKRKQTFYDTDYIDDDLPGLDQAEEEAQQEEEEKEALAIQTRMAEALEEEDFGLEIFKIQGQHAEKVSKDEKLEESKVAKDLSKLSKREKLDILKKESPEFLQLAADFKLRMSELVDRLEPLLTLIKEGTIDKDSDVAHYIHTKYQLYLCYCMNISFYMVLKAKQAAVRSHPVIARILAFRKLISELEPVEKKLRDEIDSCLDGEKTPGVDDSGPAQRRDNRREKMKRKQEGTVPDRDHPAPSKVKYYQSYHLIPSNIKHTVKPETVVKTAGNPHLSEEELKALEYYRSVACRQQEKRAKMADDGEPDDDDEEEEEAEEGKRGITYQISKNRGLTPHRRKELRTPRVKHRMKFKKAKVRRKGQVREARTELHRYGGEASGIRSGVIKSIKIK